VLEKQQVTIHEFENGLRLIHKQVSSTRIAHCGVILDIGSRDERKDEQGIAHFWEHMAFKGTQKRKAYHIINRLESVGGELNAYTTKEKVFFYGTALGQHMGRTLELLADITFDSTFPSKEIEKEAGVIIEEINMYEDSPEDAIFDEFDSLLFPNHSIGRNILGTRESVRSFRQKKFLDFISNNIDTERIVISIVSPFEFKKVLKQVEKYFGEIKRIKKSITRNIPIAVKGQTIIKPKVILQAHCVMGRSTYPITSKQRIPFYILNSIFGMGNMSSRLNMELREKRGLVYSVETDYSPFSDIGQFHIYFGTEAKQLNKSIALVHKEMNKLRTEKLGAIQLSTVKARACAQLAMSEENNAAMMQVMGKSLLDLNCLEELNTIFDKINELSASDIMAIANEMLVPDDFSTLIYKPS